MGTELVLNHDVLIMILQELSSMSTTNTDLLAAMHTCWALYRLGMKVLLGREISLYNEEMVTSFCAFLAKDKYSRATLLRYLHWRCSPISEPTSRALCSLLRHATLLKDIWLKDLGLLFRTVPELVQILAGMESLRRLSVDMSEPTQDILTFFATLHAQLIGLELMFDPCQTEDIHRESLAWDVDLLQHLSLSPSASTLHYICVDSLSMCYCEGIVFTNVTVLEMSKVLLPTTDILARAFPKLRKLELNCVWWGEDFRIGVDSATAQRDANLRAQHRHGSWSELETVSGGMLDIFALGLTCPVNSLSLRIFEGNTDRHSVGVMIERLLEGASKLRKLELETTVDIFYVDIIPGMNDNQAWDALESDATPELMNKYVRHAVHSLPEIYVSIMVVIRFRCADLVPRNPRATVPAAGHRYVCLDRIRLFSQSRQVQPTESQSRGSRSMPGSDVLDGVRSLRSNSAPVPNSGGILQLPLARDRRRGVPLSSLLATTQVGSAAQP